MRRFLWLERDYGQGVVRTDDGKVLARHENMLWPRYFALSNDGKWLAAVSRNHLVVLELVAKKWSDLGPVTIHPQPDWDYIKPSWNPWFSDSTHLAFVSHASVVIATPDGKQKTTLCRLPAHGGIATPSPDGKQVAYVTFRKRPREGRPDLAFWGDARVWVVSVMQANEPKAVTGENPDCIYCLRWLNEEEVIFDRLTDTPFCVRARLWRAVVPHQDMQESNKVDPPNR